MRRPCDDLLKQAEVALTAAAAEAQALEHEDAWRLTQQLELVRRAIDLSSP